MSDELCRLVEQFSERLKGDEPEERVFQDWDEAITKLYGGEGPPPPEKKMKFLYQVLIDLFCWRAERGETIAKLFGEWDAVVSTLQNEDLPPLPDTDQPLPE